MIHSRHRNAYSSAFPRGFFVRLEPKAALCIAAFLFLLTYSPAGAGAQGKEKSRYWALGAGAYGPYIQSALEVIPELDLARWDWLLIEVGDRRDVEAINRLLRINPKQRYLLRLWPINHLGHSGVSASTATFLCYLYKPGVREEVQKRLRNALHDVKTYISHPENVIGFTFLEELPGWWGVGGEIAHQKAANAIPEELKRHRKEIEAELGKPLVWNDETRLWLGRKYVETLAEIHRIIKSEMPDKLVLYWQHTNYATLDDIGFMIPKDAPLSTPGLYWYRYGDIIQAGLCDGFMAYPNNATVWEKKYMRHVREHDWLFFSQLSHPGRMRLQSWADVLKMVKSKMPQNLGYFFYCEGTCAADGRWNDDPDVPRDREWNLRSASIPLHTRLFAAKENIGMDVVKSYLHLRVMLDVPVKNASAGKLIHVVAAVKNTKETTYFPDPKEATASNVTVKLNHSPHFELSAAHSAPATVRVGDIKPTGYRVADWWLKVVKPLRDDEWRITVKATSDNTAGGEAAATRDVAMPSFEAHEIRRSGTSWAEPGFRLPGKVTPVIEVEGLSVPFRGFSISDGMHTVTYTGEIHAGLKVVINGLTAKLFATDIIGASRDDFADPNDPTGFKCFRDGYGVWGKYVGEYLKGGVKYRIRIAGKATGGANSQVWLRCRTRDRKLWQQGALWNAFSEKWRDDAAAEIEIPHDVNSLERIYLYRYNKKGAIWYGGIWMARADIPSDGIDVSDKLSGEAVQLQPGRMTEITYTDDLLPSPKPRARVRFHLREEGGK